VALDGTSKVVSRLIEPLMQMAPAVGTAVVAGNSKLMEVVINGPLLAASDGNGLRAIAKAGKGFEHARLFEPKDLQKVANAAAIWQIVSVVVAQKHLADISATLQRVEYTVMSIRDSMADERYAVISSAIKYSIAAKHAVEQGEFLERTRLQLESLDMDVDRAIETLVSEIRRKSDENLEMTMLGCEREADSAVKKHRYIARLVDELTLAFEARLAIWYLCSVYPDKSKMLPIRLEQINIQFKNAAALHDQLNEAMNKDCDLITSRLNKNNTINKRREPVRQMAQKGLETLRLGQQYAENIISKINQAQVDSHSTSRLLVEVKDGKPSAVYARH
jgi:hypothetical protein